MSVERRGSQSYENDWEDAKDDESREDRSAEIDPADIEAHDPLVIAQQQELISRSIPSTLLELALTDEIKRKDLQIDRLNREILKLKNFISKRKQTYKRKRKEEGAPTRALSAYNIFVQDRFSQLARDNEAALKSPDVNAQLKRVPPASLVASTGNQWKELPAEDKAIYEEKAREDRRRYEAQMAAYQPPEKQRNKKRNKTGYNMFFSAHVLQLKDSEQGVPSERGSVARLVGNAWKDLSAEEKEYYEREAEKQNAMDSEDHDNDDDSSKLPSGDAARFSPVASRGVGSRHDAGSHHDRSRFEAMGLQHGIHEGMPPDGLNRHDPYMRHDHLTLPRHDSRYGPAPHLMHQYVHPQNYVNPNPNYHGQGHHYPPHSPSHISRGSHLHQHPQHRQNNNNGGIG